MVWRREIGPAIMPILTSMMSDAQKLDTALSSFYETKHRWPRSYDELQEFNREQGPFVGLDQIKDLRLFPLEDGTLAVEFSYASELPKDPSKETAPLDRASGQIRVVVQKPVI
jgi:hypothetical protein